MKPPHANSDASQNRHGGSSSSCPQHSGTAGIPMLARARVFGEPGDLQQSDDSGEMQYAEVLNTEVR